MRALKAISRSPICVENLIQMGERLRRGELHIREVASFSEQEGMTEERVEEYLQTTLDAITELKKTYAKTLKLYERVLEEPRKSPRLSRHRRRLARGRVELSQQVRSLDLALQQHDHLVSLLRESVYHAREARSSIDKARRALEKKKWNEDERELKRNLRDAERRLLDLARQRRPSSRLVTTCITTRSTATARSD
jgi:hypothetical protein